MARAFFYLEQPTACFFSPFAPAAERYAVEPGHHSRRVRTVKAAVAHWSAHNRAVLPLDECLVVLLIGTRARHLEFLFAAPRDDHVIHEGAVVVEVHAAQKPGEQALNVLHRLSLASRVESVRAIHKRAYAQAGRLEEARAAAAEVLRINPTFTIDSWKPLAVYKDPKDLEHYLDGLRKAGLLES